MSSCSFFEENAKLSTEQIAIMIGWVTCLAADFLDCIIPFWFIILLQNELVEFPFLDWI